MNPEDAVPGHVSERLATIKATDKLRRTMDIGAIDVEARTVELSFSSETEYERDFGIEILSHAPGHVDLTRLNNGAPVLWMHNWNDQRGVVVEASIEGGKGRTVLRFSRSPEGEKLFRDIIDKIVTKVSVGYRVLDLQYIGVRNGIDAFLITKWLPYEISMVSVAADDTVGYGRSMAPQGAEPPPLEAPREETPEASKDNSPVLNDAPASEVVTQPAIEPQPKGNTRMEDDNTPAPSPEDILKNERARVRTMEEMGKKAGKEDMARSFIADGKSPEELRVALFDAFVAQRSAQPLAAQEGDAQIGMTDKDVQRYSLFKAVRSLANPNDKRLREAAAFELDCSRSAAEAYGRESRGLMIPQDVLSRAFNAGGAANTPTGATSGSNVVARELMSGSFIEMLRNRAALLRRATTMGGLVGNADIPKQTAGATGYWIAEGADATEGTPTIGQISLSPKTVAAYTDITRRLMMQSTPDAEGIVKRDLMAALALAIDKAGFYGTAASNQPRGLKNYTGINAVDFANNNPTFAELVDMETQIALDNADVDGMAYFGNASLRGYAKTTTKFGTGTSGTIWEPGNTINGYATEITNQVTQGDVFFGNFTDLIVALWGGLDMIVDTSSLSKSGGTRIVVFQDVDFALRRVESICYGVNLP